MTCVTGATATRRRIWLCGVVLAIVGVACGDDDSDDVDGSDATEVSDLGTVVSCNPVSDNGCGADETCTWLQSESGPVCVRRGTVPLEGRCSTTDRCERGVCLSINASAERCYALCERDTDCSPRGTCLKLVGSPFKVCRIEGVYDVCDLLQQDCGPSRDTDRGCYVVPSEGSPVCLPAGDLEPDMSCSSATACRAGYACVDDVCVALCDLASTNPCGPLHICKPFAYGTGVCERR